eukprot:scaffold6434_cov71-Cylindrotheca_fusiformis.AAC.1
MKNTKNVQTFARAKNIASLPCDSDEDGTGQFLMVVNGVNLKNTKNVQTFARAKNIASLFFDDD